MQHINLLLAFILEIIAFLGFASLGFLLPVALWIQILCAVVLFAGLIAFWAKYMSPKAPKKLTLPLYYTAKFVVYALASLAIYQLAGHAQGFVFFVISLCNDSLLLNYNKRRL